LATIYRRCDTLKPKALKAATKPVRQLAETIDIKQPARHRFSFHQLALHAHGGGTPAKLALSLAEPIGAANLLQNIAEPAGQMAGDNHHQGHGRTQMSATAKTDIQSVEAIGSRLPPNRLAPLAA
jgi:hypothetical protein